MQQRIKVTIQNGYILCLKPDECQHFGEPRRYCRACETYKVCRAVRNENLRWEENPWGE